MSESYPDPANLPWTADEIVRLPPPKVPRIALTREQYQARMRLLRVQYGGRWLDDLLDAIDEYREDLV